MNKSFKTRLYYDWVLYLLVAAAAILIWYFAFGLFNAPAPTETIRVFFAGKVVDRSFEDLALSKMSDNGVKLVEIDSCLVDDAAFSAKYAAVGLNGCDVVIALESVIDKTECEGTFAELNGFENVYLRDGKAYGVFLEKSAITALSAYFSFGDSNYVALIAASSVNGGDGALTDNAVVFLRWIADNGKVQTHTEN
ncbi:MAG: hypothetical protein J5762_02450 [Clostridia bacterium]|nr:hypothetical protein [Clostridia bacterium]